MQVGLLISSLRKRNASLLICGLQFFLCLLLIRSYGKNQKNKLPILRLVSNCGQLSKGVKVAQMEKEVRMGGRTTRLCKFEGLVREK